MEARTTKTLSKVGFFEHKKSAKPASAFDILEDVATALSDGEHGPSHVNVAQLNCFAFFQLCFVKVALLNGAWRRIAYGKGPSFCDCLALTVVCETV